ncbi:MAG: ACT domain-containing protein [Clostridia bacterium]|nr:ACT domain-containing protein [Clostridia bacterium]
MVIEKIDGVFSICKVENFSKINMDEDFLFTAKTDEEYSVVIKGTRTPINTIKCDRNYKMMRIQGELDFSLVGILSKITGILADVGIPVFAVSTFNTDYILVKGENFEKALAFLKDAGYEIR